MKIIALKAENIKKLIAVEIVPKGNLVQITGKNGQGKTSVLDSIWWALGGAKEIQKSPIRKSCDSGGINLDLGEIVVQRNFKINKDNEVTTSLVVQNKDGVKFPSPQAVLDKMLGDLCFDPLAFSRSTATEQFNKLRQFVPEIDFNAIDAANKEDYTKRTDVNRAIKDYRSLIQAIVIKNPEAKPEDESKLIQEMAKAGDFNATLMLKENNRTQLRKEIKEKRAEAEKLIAEANALQAKLDNAGELQARIDITELQNKINIARENNHQHKLITEKMEFEAMVVKLEEQAELLTNKIKERNDDKMQKIAKANLPLKGLSFGENEVLLNGVPFNQASDAEQLRASIAIAMALNPKLRVIRVRDGSLLDDDSLKIVEEMANKNDCQVWIERVDGTGKVGFVLEDGLVKEEPSGGEPVIDL